MSEIRQKRWVKIFVAVVLLWLAQLGWWTSAFMKDTEIIAKLRRENAALSSLVHPGNVEESSERISKDSFHRQVMFLSESIFFVILTCAGIYFFFHALRIEERAKEIQRNFIEIVTHESKTPLTALKLRLESVLEKWGSEPDVARELNLASEEVRRLISTFDKAMNLNRLERQAFEFEPLSLASIVAQVARRLEPLFRAKSVALSLDLDPDAMVKGDPDSLQNSVQSLLENAVLYNDKPSKKVSVSVHRRHPRVVLDIADNGPGINPIDQQRIFERFYRGKSGLRVSGTGLGLYIAKSVIEAHDGVIRHFSEVPSGTRFEIELPEAT